jgi:hypothetical protein
MGLDTLKGQFVILKDDKSHYDILISRRKLSPESPQGVSPLRDVEFKIYRFTFWSLGVFRPLSVEVPLRAHFQNITGPMIPPIGVSKGVEIFFRVSYPSSLYGNK